MMATYNHKKHIAKRKDMNINMKLYDAIKYEHEIRLQDFYKNIICHHEKSMVTKKQMSDGRYQHIKQCQICGETVGGSVKQDNLVYIPMFDYELQKVYRDEIKTRKENLEKIFFKELEEIKIQYHRYLESDDWKQKRNLVLKRSGEVCEGCRRASATQVHHLTYEHVYEELLYELVALCKECHVTAHKYDNTESNQNV